MAQKIAVIKTGWSEDYRGAVVEAAHAYVSEFKDGHEKFNFLPGPDGRFYAYTPPIGRQFSPPQPDDPDDWLVFAVAKAPNRPGVYLVGWYENARFLGEYRSRPEYDEASPAIPLDGQGETFSYTLVADQAVAIPYEARQFSFPGDHLKRSPIYYLRGNGRSEAWREELAQQLLRVRKSYTPPVTSQPVNPNESKKGGISADPVRRKEVEEAAIRRVKAEFPKPNFKIKDRQMDKCGFDLLVTDRKGNELHIEVKGTAMPRPHFLMSRNEYGYMRANPKPWRLAMVTDALGKPKLKLFTAREAEKEFLWEEFTWRGIARDQ